MRTMLSITIGVLLAGTAFSAVGAQDVHTPEEICAAATPAEDPENRTFDAPGQVLEPGVDYRAVMCTAAGPIYIDLFESFAPVTVNNFIFLAGEGFYDNTTFHRVIDGFMVQGGDPEGTGRGGPGYQFEDEFVGFLHFDRPGWLAMANAGAGTNGSQFFITTVPTPHLDYRHTIFGEVLQGQDNAESISLRDPETATEPGDALEALVIISDPSSVATTYEPLTTATQDEVTAAFALINELLPPDVLGIDEAFSGTFTTDDVVASLPEALQAEYAAFLSDHNHEYRATNRIMNVACDLENIAFSSVSYGLDSYATAEDAVAVLSDPALADLVMAQGLTESETFESGLTVFSSEGTACDTESITARTHWQRGHFVATVEITIPSSLDAPLDRVLASFVGQQVYERVLSDVLRPEIR